MKVMQYITYARENKCVNVQHLDIIRYLVPQISEYSNVLSLNSQQ